jgi:hypothetical protein
MTRTRAKPATPPAKEPDKGGRPRKEIDPRDLARIPQLAALLTEPQLADFLGMGLSTFRKRLEDDPEVSSAYKKGRAGAIARVAQTILSQATREKDPNITAAIFYLKTQAGWRERVEVDLSDWKEDEATDQQLERIASGEPPHRVLKLMPKAG